MSQFDFSKNEILDIINTRINFLENERKKELNQTRKQELNHRISELYVILVRNRLLQDKKENKE